MRIIGSARRTAITGAVLLTVQVLTAGCVAPVPLRAGQGDAGTNACDAGAAPMLRPLVDRAPIATWLGTSAPPPDSGSCQPSPSGFCGPDHWCWQSPVPTGNTFRALTGSGPNDVWAVGDNGLTAHWDGSHWTGSTGGYMDYQPAAWANGPSDVWVGGYGEMRHWDGSTWSSTRVGAYVTAVWGSASDDVWACGEAPSSDVPTTLHWDGATWSTVSGPPLVAGERILSIWGSSGTDVLFGSNDDKLFHWDGQDWSASSPGSTGYAEVVGLWGDATDDVWAITGSNVLRWQGTQWTSVYSTNRALTAIWGADARHVWVVGAHGTVVRWDGSSWTSLVTGVTADLSAVWGTSDTDVWVAGEAGTLAHWDGRSWSKSSSEVAISTMGAIWGANAQDVWGVGGGDKILHWNGSCWSSRPSPTGSSLIDVWGSAANDVWAVGEDGAAVHWNGVSWSVVDTGTTANLDRVVGSGPDDVWALSAGGYLNGYSGDGKLLHWNGSAWSTVTLPAVVFDVAAVGRNKLWAIGGAGRAFYWDGSTWTTMQIPAAGDAQGFGLTRVVASGPHDVWAEGGCGCNCGSSGYECDPSIVVHWDGSTWSAVPNHSILTDLWMAGPGDLWGVGWLGAIEHWNDSGWTSMQSGIRDDLGRIGGAGPGAIWTTTSGYGGELELLHYEP